MSKELDFRNGQAVDADMLAEVLDQLPEPMREPVCGECDTPMAGAATEDGPWCPRCGTEEVDDA